MSIAAGDFDRDGKSDLAIASQGSTDQVAIFKGNGAGGFNGPVEYGVGVQPRSIVVGDFNKDGNSDLAIANVNAGQVAIMLGTGVTGNFNQPTTFAAGLNPTSIAIGMEIANLTWRLLIMLPAVS